MFGYWSACDFGGVLVLNSIVYADQLSVLFLAAYLFILLGLLLTTVILEFSRTRRHLSAYFLAAAIGSFPGMMAGGFLGAFFENLARRFGIGGRNLTGATGANDQLIALIPVEIMFTSTLLLSICAVHLVFLRRGKAKPLKHPPRR